MSNDTGKGFCGRATAHLAHIRYDDPAGNNRPCPGLAVGERVDPFAVGSLAVANVARPCGGISSNGAEPPVCEVHLLPWRHNPLVRP